MSKVPQLRFPEFSGEWEMKKLAELYSFKYGEGNTNPDDGGKYPVYGANGIIGKYSKYNAENSVVIGHMGAYAGSVLWEPEKHFVTYNGTIGIPKDVLKLNTKFGYYLLLQLNIRRICSGSGYAFLSYDMLNNIKAKVASTYDEQQKIADFFTLLDQKIEKQQRKIEHLERYKKGIMQQLFSRTIRFKDENGYDYPEWEGVRISDVSESLEYGMNEAATDFDGMNKYIRITDIDDETHQYTNNNVVSPNGNLNAKYRVRENDILLARTGASTGKSYIYKKEDGILYFAGFLIRARIQMKYDARFIFYQTLSYSYAKWVEVMSMRSGQPGINATEFGSYKFLLPNGDEQRKIAGFLTLLDLKIGVNNKKLECLTRQKKGLMQKMFI